MVETEEQILLEEKVFATLRELETRQGETPLPVSATLIIGELLFVTSGSEVMFTLGVLSEKGRIRVCDYTENYITVRSI